MSTPRKVVAITGASGYVGSRLLQSLEDEPDITRLVAFDISPLPWPIHNIAAYRQDVSEPIDDELLQQRVTTLVHLAFIARPGITRREAATIRAENLGALKCTLDSCVRGRVEHFIYLSSHTVYGAHADNPVPLTDNAPMRPLPDYAFGYDKWLSELMIQKYAEEHEDIKFTVLRPSIVLGPAADNYFTKTLFRKWLFGVQDYNPPLQFLYEDDLARVLTCIIRQGVPGVFNVAGDGVVFYQEMAEIIQSRLFSLPPFLAYPLVRLTWNLHLQRHATASALDLVRYPMVLSTGKLSQAIGYKFRSTSLDALNAFANFRLMYDEPGL